MTAEQPHGPGFPKAEPSVKIGRVVAGMLEMCRSTAGLSDRAGGGGFLPAIRV